MAKIANYTALISLLFLIVLFFIIVFPIESLMSKNVEQIFDDNKGLIRLTSLIVGVGWIILTFIMQQFAKELNDKNSTIEKQNIEIISNQKKSLKLQQEYIDIVSKLNITINDNSVRDLETVGLLKKIQRRVENNEAKIKELEKLSA